MHGEEQADLASVLGIWLLLWLSNICLHVFIVRGSKICGLKEVIVWRVQMSLLAFRMQFIVAGPGLIPWAYDAPFLAGMNDYLGPDSGVGNLTIRNWAEVNLANFPVRPFPLSDYWPEQLP